MGFNATVVVLLDQLHSIEKDPDFGKKLGAAIRHRSMDSKGDHPYVTGQTQVVEVHHADGQVVVTVGGNCGRVLGYGGSYRATDEEIIKSLNSRRLYEARQAKAKGAA